MHAFNTKVWNTLFRYTIKDLDLHGTDMAYVPLEEFGIMKNLRTVGIAKTRGNVMNMQGNLLKLLLK